MKNYYGIIYFGGNRTCTTGEPNKYTKRLNIACGIEVFTKKEDLENWLDKEDLYKNTGSGGGERIAATKQECREHCYGMTIDEFNDFIDNQVKFLED